MLASWLGLDNQANVDELKRQLSADRAMMQSAIEQIATLQLGVTHLRTVVQNLEEDVDNLKKDLDDTDEHQTHIADTVNSNFAKCRKKFNKLALHLNLPCDCEHTWIVDLAPTKREQPEEFCSKCGIYKTLPDPVPASVTIEASENFKTTDRSPLVD